MEGLVAFFFESTFIGLWIFGWTRLPRLVHLARIWIVAIAVNMSAFFIIAANSFMQHPVGAHFNPETVRAELTSIVALFTNNTALAAFPHAVAGAFLTAGTFVAAVCAWWLVRARTSAEARTMYRPAAILGCFVVLASAAGLFFTGDAQGKLMFQQQPMKMASAESLCHTFASAVGSTIRSRKPPADNGIGARWPIRPRGPQRWQLRPCPALPSR
jgi:cytochrome d ubiquinol oxidase subunit I